MHNPGMLKTRPGVVAYAGACYNALSAECIVEVFIVLQTVLMVIQFLVSIFLILVVLLQQSAGEGLGSIGGGAQMFFNKNKGLDSTLEKATTVAAVAFMVLSMVLALII